MATPLLALLALLPAALAGRGPTQAPLVPARHRHLTHLLSDPEPVELRVEEVAGKVQELTSQNPKNGTPWFRFKPVKEKGQSTHRHFGSLTASGDFAADIMEAHNVVRRRAGLSLLEVDDGLLSMATERVEELSSNGCYIRHLPVADRWEASGFTYVGENLYKVIGMEPTGVDVVDAWYAEIEDYTYGPVGASCTRSRCAGRAAPPCTLGHFTQVMWAETTSVGCAVAKCPAEAKKTFISVCHYGPGGNIVGRLPFSASQGVALGVPSRACEPLVPALSAAARESPSVSEPGAAKLPPGRSRARGRCAAGLAVGLLALGALA